MLDFWDEPPAPVGEIVVRLMTVAFLPRPRVAEVRFRPSNGRERSFTNRGGGSSDGCYIDDWFVVGLAGHDLDLGALRAFATQLYKVALKHNDPRFRLDGPKLLSMTFGFAPDPDDYAIEIRWLEFDGRLTTAARQAGGTFVFQYSQGGSHCVKPKSDIDSGSLLRLAAGLCETLSVVPHRGGWETVRA